MRTKITDLDALKFLFKNNFKDEIQSLGQLIKVKSKVRHPSLDNVSMSLEDFIEQTNTNQTFYHNFKLLKKSYYSETQVLNYSHTFGWIIYDKV